MSDGVLNNYLSEDEKKYFESRGENEAAIEASQEDVAPNYENNSSDVVESEDSKEVAPESLQESTIAASNEEDLDAESQDSKRDYEKAFKTELHKRKELKEQLEATNRRTLELEATLNALREGLQNQKGQQAVPQEPAEVAPDPEVDPLGYQEYKIKKLESLVVGQQEYLRSQYEHNQRSAQQQAFMDTYKASAAEFSNKAPDFMDAYNYLVESRINEHLAAGYTRQEADALVVEEEMAIASRAFRDKVNPAERLYALAKNRGFGAASPAKTTPVKNLDSVKKGIENAKSLKSGGGELPDRAFGLDDVDSMNFEEFDKFWAGYKNKAKRS